MDAQVTSEKELRQLQRENNSRLLQKLDSQNKQISSQNKQISSLLSSLKSKREEAMQNRASLISLGKSQVEEERLFSLRVESELESTVSRMESTISRITSLTKIPKTAKSIGLKIAAYWDERHPPKRLPPRKLRPKISRRRFAGAVFA